MRPRFSIIRILAVTCLYGVPVLANAACGGSTDDKSSTVNLRFSWWGNNDRAKTTQQVIDAFQAKNPNIKIKGETTDFNSYFERLATQIASKDAPDVITLGGAYPREYGGRGALLDLAKVKSVLKTDGIDATALTSGAFDNKQYGVPTGVNTFAVVADPTVFEKAGVALPNDDSWTWDDFNRIARDIAAKSPKGTYGLQDPMKTDILDLYSRQRGESLYTTDGKVGISEQTLNEVWTMTLGLRDSGATPSASLTAELATQPAPEQSLLGRGLAGMQFDWSNQLSALRKASGHKLVLLRTPGENSAKQHGMWLQASQLYTINARSKHAKDAARFIDFLVNSEEAGKLILTDRGIPANAQVRSAIVPTLNADQAAQVQFVERATKQMGAALIIGPTGSTESIDILRRLNEEVLFNRMKPAVAASEFIKQVKAAIKQ